MSYKLLIMKDIPNPEYAEQLRAHETTARYTYMDTATRPVPTFQERHLEVTVTDEEFVAIKRAVLGVI